MFLPMTWIYLHLVLDSKLRKEAIFAYKSRPFQEFHMLLFSEEMLSFGTLSFQELSKVV